MPGFTQKYTLIHSIDPLTDGYEYAMEQWPLHITMADVFALNGSPTDLLASLGETLGVDDIVRVTVNGDRWFGEDGEVHVKTFDASPDILNMHENILRVLEMYGVVFNHPEYTREGFVAHSTVQKEKGLRDGETVTVDRLTLIDMFPNENPYRRRVLGTVALNG